MKYQYIKQHCSGFRVRKMCRVLGVSQSGYYRWSRQGQSKRAVENDQLVMKIRQIHKGSRELYGSPRIANLMRLGRVVAKTKRRFKVTTTSKHKLGTARNLVNRDFTVSEPKGLWASEITYIWTGEGWLYLVVIMDVYSSRIVGWSMSRRLTQELAIQALRQALWRRRPHCRAVCFIQTRAASMRDVNLES